MAFPVVQAMVNKSGVYGHKLLVSTSFMINHIFKYHNTGFSWRNLEHIPELLEINKTPELRDFIGSIIQFLKQTHLTFITSGLYQFKFPMSVSEEITFHSKMSEEMSAIFNFTLDESLSVKRHYTRLLRYYSDKNNSGSADELHALASIHHILGDIYLADEDYPQAIFEYENALQLLDNQLKQMKDRNDYDSNPHWVSHILFYMRCMLKLGLAYEKRKTFNSAYLAYSELVHQLVDFRFFKEEEIGLRYEMVRSDNELDKKAMLFDCAHRSSNPGEESGETPWEISKFTREILPNQWNKQFAGYTIESNRLRSSLSLLLTPAKSAVIMRLSLFEEIRMIYLASLSKLFVLEKMERGGITKTNIDVIESEFTYLHRSTNEQEKFAVSSDFYRKFLQHLLPHVTNTTLYTYDFHVFYYEDMAQYLSPLPVENWLESYKTANKTCLIQKMDEKLDLVNFLIGDSMFCLSKILDWVTPLSNSTLFTHSFVAEIYREFLYWSHVFENQYDLYSAYDKRATLLISEHLPELRKQVSAMNNRKMKEKTTQIPDLILAFKRCVRLLTNQLSSGEVRAQPFMTYIQSLIGIENYQNLINNYLAESAHRRYVSAVQTHTEGKAYKELIDSLYFLDDDLSNDTCQFLFAMERYKMNCGVIDRNIQRLKSISRQSPIFKSDSYFNHTKY